ARAGSHGFDGSPGFLGLNLEAHDIAPPALVTDGRDHAPDLGAQSAGPQRAVAALLNRRSAHPSPIPQRLRRAADTFPRARWEASNEHLAIMSGDTVVGSFKKWRHVG